MRKIYFIDFVHNYGDVEQYGRATFSREEAEAIFKEAVHAYNLDDFWSGTAFVVENADAESLILREIDLPEENIAE